jgi:hypothetical protein
MSKLQLKSAHFAVPGPKPDGDPNPREWWNVLDGAYLEFDTDTLFIHCSKGIPGPQGYGMSAGPNPVCAHVVRACSVVFMPEGMVSKKTPDGYLLVPASEVPPPPPVPSPTPASMEEVFHPPPEMTAAESMAAEANANYLALVARTSTAHQQDEKTNKQAVLGKVTPKTAP